MSYQDCRFTSNTWKDFQAVTGICTRMSTTFHAQTVGQTRRVNPVIKEYHPPFLNQDKNDWEDLLPTVEFAYNNSVTSVTEMTYFYANYGWYQESQNP